jgi:hypothetical protein
MDCAISFYNYVLSFVVKSIPFRVEAYLMHIVSDMWQDSGFTQLLVPASRTNKADQQALRYELRTRTQNITNHNIVF